MLLRVLAPILLVVRDLTLRIESAALSGDRIEQIVEDAHDPQLFALEPSLGFRFPRFWRRRAKPGFMYSADLHDALTDDADWNASSWDVTDVGTKRLVATISYLGTMLPDGFQLQALWAGDTPLEVKRVSLDEMVDIASSGGLGTRTTYEVVPGPCAQSVGA